MYVITIKEILNNNVINLNLEAIQRYFQSRQRIWREDNQEQTERNLKQAKSRKLRSRKVRVGFTYSYDDHYIVYLYCFDI